MKVRGAAELLRTADPSSPEGFAARLRDAALNLSEALDLMEPK